MSQVTELAVPTDRQQEAGKGLSRECGSQKCFEKEVTGRMQGWGLGTKPGHGRNQLCASEPEIWMEIRVGRTGGLLDTTSSHPHPHPHPCHGRLKPTLLPILETRKVRPSPQPIRYTKGRISSALRLRSHKKERPWKCPAGIAKPRCPLASLVSMAWAGSKQRGQVSNPQ